MRIRPRWRVRGSENCRSIMVCEADLEQRGEDELLSQSDGLYFLSMALGF